MVNSQNLWCCVRNFLSFSARHNFFYGNPLYQIISIIAGYILRRILGNSVNKPCMSNQFENDHLKTSGYLWHTEQWCARSGLMLQHLGHLKMT